MKVQRLNTAAWLFGFGVICGAANAQHTVTQLGELNTTPPGIWQGAGAGWITGFAGRIFCTSGTPDVGNELFVSDGTPEGTGLFVDVWQGGSSNPKELTVSGSQMFFTATVSSSIFRPMFVTDGTVGGTRRVPPPPSGVPSYIGVERIQPLGNGVVFYGVRPEFNQSSVYFTDGTSVGTVLLSGDNRFRIVGQGDNLYGPNLVSNGTYAAFSAFTPGITNAEPWITDGTPAGTQRIADINPGLPTSNPSSYTFVGATLYFKADDGTGAKLYAYDYLTRSNLRSIGRVGQFQTKVLGVVLGSEFLFFGGADEDRLMATTGTPEGTRTVATPGGNGFQVPYGFTMVSDAGRIYFVARTQSSGEELWTSDGTTAGTRIVRDLLPGNQSGITPPYTLTMAGGRVFFAGNDGQTGIELWSSDGTSAGTRLVSDRNPGRAFSYPVNITNVNGDIYLGHESTVQGESGLYLATPDGNSETNYADFRPRPVNLGSNPQAFTAIDNAAIFFAGSGVYRTDGTAAGTVRLAPNFNVTLAGTPVKAGGTVFFPGQGRVCRTDGTGSGTGVIPGPSGEDYSSADRLVSLDGNVLFSATSAGRGSQIWKATAAGATAERITNLSSPGVGGGRLVVFGDRMYFVHDLPGSNVVYSTRGTADGTRIEDLGSSLASAFKIQMQFAATGRLYLAVQRSSSSQNTEFWSTDGTGTGSVQIGTIPGVALFGTEPPLSFAEVGSACVVRVNLLSGGDGVYFTNGVDQPVLLRSATSGDISILGAFGDRVFLSASDQSTGIELWSTDGTPQGTALFKDLLPGFASSLPRSWTVAGNRFFFDAITDLRGREFWSSDGTPDGTRVVTDANRGLPWSASDITTTFASPSYALITDPSGSRKVVFAADLNLTGMEPTVMGYCPADINDDGFVNADDFGDFITRYFGDDTYAGDYNADGIVNADDLADYVTDFFSGCP